VDHFLVLHMMQPANFLVQSVPSDYNKQGVLLDCVLRNTQGRDVSNLHMITVHRILATMEGFVHKTYLVIFAVAFHHSLV